MLEIPTNLVPVADIQRAMEASRPRDSEFSKYFPRIRGTPQRRSHVQRDDKTFVGGRRLKKLGVGFNEFVNWADKMVTFQKIELTSGNFDGHMDLLLNQFCKVHRIMGSQKSSAKMRWRLEASKLKKEFRDFEKSQAQAAAEEIVNEVFA